jgi:hypothetical protein
MASRHAQAAAGAFFFVYFDDFTFHKMLPFCRVFLKVLLANATDGGD